MICNEINRDGASGVALYELWITSTTDQFENNYVISSQKENLYRGNKQDLTTLTTNVADDPTRLAINQGNYASHTSGTYSH